MKKKLPIYINPANDSTEYKQQLNTNERKYIERFDDEWHRASGEDLLLTDDQKKEARRNHNSLYRDLYNVKERSGQLSNLDELTERFMENASDEWDWQNCYKLHGFKAAGEMILEQTLNNLENGNLEKRVTLARFFEQMTSLIKTYRYDKNQKRKQHNE